MSFIAPLRKHKRKAFVYALAAILTGYLVIDSILFYFYRSLNSPYLGGARVIYVILQGTNFTFRPNQFNASELLVTVLVLVCIWAFVVTARKNKTQPELGGAKTLQGQHRAIVISLALLLSLAIMGRRYLILAHPSGYDTPLYVAEILGMEHSGINPYTLSYLSCSALFYPLTFIGMQAEDIVKIIPILLTVFATVATYEFCKESNFTDARIPYLAAIFVPVSLAIVQQSDGLFKSLLTYSLILVSFVLLLRFIRTGNKLALITLSIILPYMMLSYGIGWILFATSALSFAAFDYFRNRRKEIIVRVVFVFLSSLLFVIAGLFFSAYSISRYIVALLEGYTRTDLGGVISDFLLIQVEQSLLVVLSIVGLLGLKKLSKTKNDERTELSTRIMLSYCFVISAGFLFTNYRLLLYMPFPILSAIGLTTVLQKLEKKRRVAPKTSDSGKGPNHRTSVRSMIVISLVFVIVLSSALYYEDNLCENTSYPPADAADSLKWIAQNYGSNSIVIVNSSFLQNNTNLDFSEVNWIPAIIPPRIYRGDSIYLGTIFSFMNGEPSRLAGYPLADPSFFGSFYNDFLSGKLHAFIVDGFWYNATSSEKAILTPLYSIGNYTVYSL